MQDDKGVSSTSVQPSPRRPNDQKVWSVLALLLMVFAVGFIGGWLAINVSDDADGTVDIENGQQIVLQESEVIADVAEDVSPSVVSIVVQSQSAGGFFFEPSLQEGAGTGIILDESGLIVTNKHVIPENVTSVTIVLSDGREITDVEVVGRDPFNDIAFLQANGVSDLKPARLGDSSNVRVGDKAIAIGNALGEFENTVTAGIISGLGRPIVAGDISSTSVLQNLFQTDAAINPGNSGGPLLNISGEVIAINTAVAGGGAQNIGFAIPINEVKPLYESVRDNGRLVRPYLGVRYISLNPGVAADLGLDVTEGAYIFSDNGQVAIFPDSPADKAGLQEGDIVIAVNGQKIDDNNPLVTLISGFKVGETATLTVIRGGEEISIDVTFEEVPEQFNQ